MASVPPNDDGWVYVINPLHQAYVVDLFKFIKGQDFDKDAHFTREDFCALRPIDIVRWLQQRAYCYSLSSEASLCP